ncbi:hypothetical protein HMP0721_1771 [Pseudoramibacter alactolyticus ATCC 23263]|jgi:hypothetical protein|uniref:Uncharacterized protein n=1 Tax=Pseudoramibacter alactolyticus ATCC 23263 TaxID=887929 RepID=E6MID6_9FIRM|nr:hypothetical protein HMP0721_1771 [Pseudoramibacter alactolyticus ATCC 23263]
MILSLFLNALMQNMKLIIFYYTPKASKLKSFKKRLAKNKESAH